MRRSGWIPAANTTELEVDFLKGVPLGCNALVISVDPGRLVYSSLGKIWQGLTHHRDERELAKAEAEARKRGEIPCEAFLFVSKNADGFNLSREDRATPKIDVTDMVLAARARATFKRPRGMPWLNYEQSNAQIRSVLSGTTSDEAEMSRERSRL